MIIVSGSAFFLSGNENDDKINATEELTPKFKGEKGESSVTQFWKMQDYYELGRGDN